ncbi:hypothetical protein D9613_001576 [Agrocybe pediades]|uniref:UvrD-like helicase ATP-binding domain-containing protein n=1 Tax=Agrocybe pediades TaxID=84607 RepID=A0A8H4VXV1_9AGAR|nr:hypothetical protein D9613_001576 [Agrocybe pediades]
MCTDPHGPDINHVLQLLADDELSTEQELQHALLTVEGLLCIKCYPSFIRAVLSPPQFISRPLLGVFLSSKPGKTFGDWLYSDFPQDPEIYLKSFYPLLLERISFYILFLHHFERDESLQLSKCRTVVENSSCALRVLIQMKDKSQISHSVDAVQDENTFFFTGKRTQRQRKEGRHGSSKASFDAKAIRALELCGLDAQDFSQAETNIASLMLQLRSILTFYVSLLQRPEVRVSILRGFFPPRDAEPEVLQPSPESTVQTQESHSAETTVPLAFPMVQPMKAALYFDSVDGFGEWRILISTRADRDLRDARRKNTKLFKIIIKKIKELSQGHFSDDNQKRLNGSNTEIPIYEAKMTGDTRLVYQIDCIPEYNSDVERQVIRIFGIYTHAQIDKRLWDSVGHQLAKKGKEYRHRCIFRNKPQLAGDNVYTPACFPAADKVEDDDYVLPELPRESLEEMHSVLVLEKFVAFSQALLNSIIADLDVAHVFNVSPQEKEIIEYPHSCYVLGRSGTGKTTTMLFKMLGIERAYTARKDTMQKPRQIFVTQSRVLAGKVEEYFAKLLDSLATADRTREELAHIVKSNRQKQEETGLVDEDDDHNWRADLPKEFSELQDQHFPLFITFDRLAALLEGDLAADTSRTAKQAQGGSPTTDAAVLTFRNGRLITYDVFLESYWPHFSQTLKKGLDPALVFSELMGVIQGSEESLSNENGFLEKETYEGLSHRTQYAFVNKRDIIYNIFLQYVKRKKTLNEYDGADRTHNILRALRRIGVPGQKIDYLYVDEAQDNLLIDALLLRSLVQNPNGLFWAGDTAQTISIGSSFRFDDLKAFLFRLEKRREGILAHGASSDMNDPKSFQLATNYRSHGGIVQCAHSVIELITEFWPHAIDILSRERGVVDGSKPVFFSGWDSDTVRYEQFLFGESGSRIEFGAQQCILVRDEASREELRKQVGDIGLIMTLYESKGLEFDDVLLYKFFEDSTVELSQWRLVLNRLSDHGGTPAPRFDEVRHAGVCSELKFLYVAITRARKNLWLVDCSEKGEPMRQFWTARNEIQNCTPGTDVPRLAVSSSPEEWEKSGRALFQNKRYFQAMHCFERAGLKRETDVSHAYYLREQARSMPSTGTKESIVNRRAAFVTAAEAFLQRAIGSNAKEAKAYLRTAGDCYEHAQEDQKAAEAYARAEEYNSAAKLYRKCARFDEAVAIVLDHRQDVDHDIAENIIDVARLYYFKSGELEKTTQLFSSTKEQLVYLEDFDLDASRAALLEQLGQFQEAAQIHLQEGRIREAIRLYLQDSSDDASLHRGITCILQGLWERASFGVTSIHQIQEVVDLLNQAERIQLKDIYTDELAMFRHIKAGDTAKLLHLGRHFALEKKSINAAMCYDHAFHVAPKMSQMSVAEISDFLDHFGVYCNLLQSMVNMSHPIQDPGIRKLFHIVPDTANMFSVAAGTFLHENLIASRASVTASTEQGVLVSEYELAHRFKGFLIQRLKRRIGAENDACRYEAQALRPCPSFVINGYCNRVQCPRQHIRPSSMTRDWFDSLVKIHLRQILIVQASFVPPYYPPEKMKNIRHWMARFFETLYPISFQFGSISNFAPARLPEHRRAFEVLRQWCLEYIYWRGHQPRDSRTLTSIYQVIKLYVHLDKATARQYLLDSPLLHIFSNHPDYIRVQANHSIYIIPGLVHAITTVNPASVLQGVLFVKHVVDKMLPIDAGVLCHAVELFCGSVILLRKKMNLHNVNLPLSWLKQLVPMVSFDPRQVINMNLSLDILLLVIRDLIEVLSRNTRLEYLLADNSNLSSIPNLRIIYLARLCRTLALVGYNINNIQLREQIVRCFRSIKSNIVYPQGLISRYAHVVHFRQVSNLVPKCTDDTPLDEMIQLYQEGAKTSQAQPPTGIRRVLFKNPDALEISRILESLPIKSKLRVDAPEFVPKPKLPEELPEAQQPVEQEPDAEIEEPEVDNTEIVNTASSAESIAVDSLPEAEEVNSAPSEEKIQAAVKLQTLYRKKLRRRRVVAKTAQEASRNSCFESCLAESAKIEWPQGSFYRFLFLGPLAHVLVCLNAAYTSAMETKKRNKQRLSKASHQDLEEVNKRMTEQVKIIHKIKALQKALNPPSELHRKRDVEELKNLVLQVEALLRDQIAPNVAKDVEEDMAMALKGIVAEKQPPKPKPQKPALVMDDEYDERYGYDETEEYDCDEVKSVAQFEQEDEEERDKEVGAGAIKVEAPEQPNYEEKENVGVMDAREQLNAMTLQARGLGAQRAEEEESSSGVINQNREDQSKKATQTTQINTTGALAIGAGASTAADVHWRWAESIRRLQ